MRTVQAKPQGSDPDPVVAAATAGDESAFSELVGRYRRELQAHTYRILGSHEDSEDSTQETFLRAWRMRESYRGRASFRAWLYRIATNTSLSALERRRQAASVSMEPRLGEQLEGIVSTDAEPDAEVVSKETIELALLVAIQHLPPRQRAVLIARDVLGWPACQTAALLGTSVAAVNSALQRARTRLRAHLPRRRLEWRAGPDPSKEERALLQRYLDAFFRADSDALAAMLREDLASAQA